MREEEEIASPPMFKRHVSSRYAAMDTLVGARIPAGNQSTELQDKFERLVRPHRGTLRSHAWYLTGNVADAEDLVQDTLIRAYHYLGVLTCFRSIRGWLLTIQINIFRNQYRHRRTRAAEVSAGFWEDELAAVLTRMNAARSMEETFLDTVRQQEILEVVAQLPARYRQVICLVDLEELSYQETAERLGIPVGTVRSRLFRARKQLVPSLRPLWDGRRSA